MNQEFLTLLEQTSDFVYFKDRDSRIRFCSQAMARLCGYQDWREMVGKHDFEIFPEETARIYHEEELPVLREGKPLLNKIDPYVDPKGERRWVSTNKWPLLGDDGKTVVGLFGISRDITELKRAQEEMQRQALRNETLLRSASDGIHVLDSQGHLREANDAFCRMLGYTHEEALGLSVSQWDARWSDQELKNEIIPRLLDHREVFETKHRRRDGQIIDVEVSAVGVDLGSERVLFAASRDISERKRMEDALRERERKIESIFMGAPVGIAVLVDRVFAVVNDVLCRTTGYSQAELLGQPTRMLYFSDEEFELTGSRFYSQWQGVPGFAAETQFRHKDGRSIDVLLTMTAHDPENPRAEATFMVMDITERKRAEDNTRRLAAELMEANRLKDTFTDVLRHDILNPVGAISLAAHMLQGMEPDARKAALLERVQRNVARLLEMTDNAAKLASLAAGQAPELRESDPVQVLRSVLPELEHLLTEKGIRLSDHSAAGFTAMCNPMIKDVFANLISNAIKYSPGGTRIDVGVEDHGKSWLFYVKDEGEGVADEHKQRIFSRFERLGKEGVKGSGLGLTIAKTIVGLHGGEIWVEDNPPGGSIFFVRLPKTPSPGAPRSPSPDS